MKSDSDSDLILSWSLPYLCVIYVLDPRSTAPLVVAGRCTAETTGGRREDAVLHAVFVGGQALGRPVLDDGVARQRSSRG